MDRGGQGTKCEIKRLYNHSKDKTALWSDFEDPAKEELRLKALGYRSAIVQKFSKKQPSEGEDLALQWETQTLEVQSPRLRSFLEEIFKGYPGWNSGPAPFTFVPPFKGFFHVWDKVQEESGDKQKDYNVRAEVALLRDALKPSLTPHFAELKQIKDTKAVLFRSLWLIFAPGTLVVTDLGGHVCVSKLQSITLKKKTRGFSITGPDTTRWHLHLLRYDWNGSYCGFTETTVDIPKFAGSQSVTALAAYPFEFLPNQAEVHKRLLDRGRKFASLRGFSVKNCTGSKYITENGPGGLGRIEIVKPVSARVIIDGYAYYKCQNRVPPQLSRSNEGNAPESSTVLTEDGQALTPAYKERKEELPPLTDTECILSFPRVRGFDLTTKEWCEFNIDDLQEPDWNDTAYEKLVLPEGEKELVMAFADRARIKAQGFDDFVRNKGEGIIILLCGPPGVGKTLTAEAVAEKSKVPIYFLSAGELGRAPKDVECALDKALECCRLWDAILLLDEGDVFLGTRTSDSVTRNGLVSIFLRRLEYYRGLMFLTTNRINAIDPAFKSRADLILPYPNLDALARRGVWSNFLSRLAPGAFQITDDDLTELAQRDMNGREIKNTIKTAQILSSPDGLLTMKHLHIVLNIRKRYYDAEEAELIEESSSKRQKLD